MTKLLKLFADPDRMRTRFHGHPCRRHVHEPLLYRLRGSPKAASVHNFAILVERAVMAPNIPKVDADCHGNSRLSAWASAMRYCTVRKCFPSDIANIREHRNFSSVAIAPNVDAQLSLTPATCASRPPNYSLSAASGARVGQEFMRRHKGRSVIGQLVTRETLRVMRSTESDATTEVAQVSGTSHLALQCHPAQRMKLATQSNGTLGNRLTLTAIDHYIGVGFETGYCRRIILTCLCSTGSSVGE
jgi:hypothetical protein